MKVHHLQETSLRYFLEVARCGSISEASQRLQVAGSAISRQISHLEAVLGTTLFERRPRGMVPSPAGEILAAHASKAALDADRVVQDITDLQGIRQGKIRLAASEGFAVEFIPTAIAAFRRDYPGLTFHLTVATPAEVSRQVQKGEVDIGVTFSRTMLREIKVEYTQPAPVRAIMHRDHPLAPLGQVSLSQMAAYPLALPERDTTVRQLFDIACSLQQRLIEPVMTSNYIVSLHNFARVSHGISISGEVTVRGALARGDLAALPIVDRGMDARSLELQTLVGRSLPQSVQLFLDFLVKMLGE